MIRQWLHEGLNSHYIHINVMKLTLIMTLFK